MKNLSIIIQGNMIFSVWKDLHNGSLIYKYGDGTILLLYFNNIFKITKERNKKITSIHQQKIQNYNRNLLEN